MALPDDRASCFLKMSIAGDWQHPYSRETVAFPLPGVRVHKYWAPVKRLDQVYGDRNFVRVPADGGVGGGA